MKKENLYCPEIYFLFSSQDFYLCFLKGKDVVEEIILNKGKLIKLAREDSWYFSNCFKHCFFFGLSCLCIMTFQPRIHIACSPASVQGVYFPSKLVSTLELAKYWEWCLITLFLVVKIILHCDYTYLIIFLQTNLALVVSLFFKA